MSQDVDEIASQVAGHGKYGMDLMGWTMGFKRIQLAYFMIYGTYTGNSTWLWDITIWTGAFVSTLNCQRVVQGRPHVGSDIYMDWSTGAGDVEMNSEIPKLDHYHNPLLSIDSIYTYMHIYIYIYTYVYIYMLCILYI